MASCCVILSPEPLYDDKFHLVVFSNYPLIKKIMKPQKTRQKNSVRNWVFEQQTRPKNCKFSQILQAKTKKKNKLWFLGLFGKICQKSKNRLNSDYWVINNFFEGKLRSFYFSIKKVIMKDTQTGPRFLLDTL